MAHLPVRLCPKRVVAYRRGEWVGEEEVPEQGLLRPGSRIGKSLRRLFICARAGV